MRLTIIKENHPLIACVTLVDIKHLIYDNEVLTGMDSSACNPLVLFYICYLVSSIFKVMLAESSLFSLKAIQVLDCILPLKFF